MDSSRDIHILAVDDSYLDRKVVERLLLNSSYKVTTVDSALRALEVLGIVGTSPVVINAVKINLIITDYCMPEMTGYDLLKKVKESSALKEIPVVIMSSENVAERITMCLAEGAKEFILKPLRAADVKRLRSHVKPEDDVFEVEDPGSVLKRKPEPVPVLSKQVPTLVKRPRRTAADPSTESTSTEDDRSRKGDGEDLAANQSSSGIEQECSGNNETRAPTPPRKEPTTDDIQSNSTQSC